MNATSGIHQSMKAKGMHELKGLEVGVGGEINYSIKVQS